MKKAELIKLLEHLTEEDEIVVAGYHCEILGEYSFNDTFDLVKTQAYKTKRGGFQMTISNYIQEEDTLVDVWELG